jgi:hypothetical protein
VGITNTLLLFVILLPLFTVQSNYGYSENKADANNPSLTIKTDKDIYKRGETITISGNISKLIEGSEVFLRIFNPSNTNEYDLVFSTRPNIDGRYEYKVKVNDVVTGLPNCINGFYTIDASYDAEENAELYEARTTFQVEPKNQTVYASRASIYNFPELFPEQYVLETNVLGYIFLENEPVCDFVAIFKISDVYGYVHQLKVVEINSTNSVLNIYSDSAFDPPLTGVELTTNYLEAIKIDESATYFLEVYTWTDVQSPTPIADVIKLQFAVLEQINR